MYKSRNTAKIAVVAITVVLVAVGSYSLVSSNINLPSKNVDIRTVLGPMVNVDPSSLPANNTSISLQIFSTVPDGIVMHGMGSFSLSGLNRSNNPYYVQLLNVTFNSSSPRFFLSPMFYIIASQWSSILSTRHNEPSLTVEATMNVWNSTSTSLYGYYNNIPFKPWNVHQPVMVNNTTILHRLVRGSDLNLTLHDNVYISNALFNISLNFQGRPYQIIPTHNSNSNISSQVKPSTTYYTRYYTTTGTSSDTYDTTTGVNYTNGYFPLTAVHLSRGVTNGESELDVGAGVFLQNTTLGINSANSYESGSGQYSSTMSTNPSQGFVENGSFDSGYIAGSNGYDAFPPANPTSNQSIMVNRTTAFVAITNATYEFVHYNQYTRVTTTTYHWEQTYYYEPGKGYVFEPPKLQYTSSSSSTSYDGHGTIGQITHIGTRGNINMVAGFLDTEVNTVIQKVLGSSYSGNLTLDVGGSISQSTVWDSYSGYSNSASVIKEAHDALAVFSASLGLGLAITDTLAALNSADADATEPSIVADSINLISQATGMAATVTGLFSTISFLAKSDTAFIGSGMSNEQLPGLQGSNYTIAYYQSSIPITFSYNGNSYSFYAPADYFNATGIA
ncbi:MAG: hypothetical protein ACYCSA_06525 [Thermoplasmataceae archaeon]